MRQRTVPEEDEVGPSFRCLDSTSGGDAPKGRGDMGHGAWKRHGHGRVRALSISSSANNRDDEGHWRARAG